jgi:hypothetical protein
LPFLPERIGRWWSNSEELDVVAVSDTEQAILVGECKWSAKAVGVNILVDLQRKTQALLTETGARHVFYALFSKTGFTPDLITLAKQEGVLLVDAPELLVEQPTWRTDG